MRERLKGVVFDVDGTLLTSAHQVTPRMKTLCAVLAGRGIWLSIASARPPESVRRIAASIDAKGPLCALNGAIIIDQDGTFRSRLSLPHETVRSLIKRFKNDPRASINIYSGNDWLVLRVDKRVAAEAEVVGFKPTRIAGGDNLDSVEKILLITDVDYAAELTHTLPAEYDHIVVVRSHPDFVEITPKGVNKATGVAQAASAVGLSMRELVACGDGENDIELLQCAGYGIAMGHAPTALKGVARRSVGSNDDDSLTIFLASIFTEGPERSMLSPLSPYLSDSCDSLPRMKADGFNLGNTQGFDEQQLSCLNRALGRLLDLGLGELEAKLALAYAVDEWLDPLDAAEADLNRLILP